MSQPPDGHVSIDNHAPNQGAQGTMSDVTVNNYHASPLLPDAPRSLMLAKVRASWITGVLEQSLYSLIQLQPGLRSDLCKVDLPIRALVQEAGGSAEDLPDGMPIASVFDRFGGALLILGAPGAGKTTLLLELCRALLDQAVADPTHLMPVVFPLSTCAAERKPLAEWLVDQFVTLYQVRRKVAEGWVAVDQVRCLLNYRGTK
jgi:predicted NACHT family NTPase